MIINKLILYTIILYLYILIFINIFLCNRRLIIVCDKYGRLGNRLFLFSQLIEYSTRSSRDIWVPGFYEYRKLFKRTRKNSLVSFPQNTILTINPFPEKLSYIAINHISHNFDKLFFKKCFQKVCNYEESDQNPFHTINESNAKVILFNGFVFHNQLLDTENSYHLIKKMFKPYYKYDAIIKEPIDSLKSKCSLVVGILIRQTDYREWNNGKYFYESELYDILIKEIIKCFNDINIGFFIATDEKQSQNLFQNIECIIRVGYPLENMYSLSMCDFLIGPPSSFIGWSSYYGNKSLFTISNKNTFYDKSYYENIKNNFLK